MDPPPPRSRFCYLPTPAKAIAKSHKNQTTIAGEKRWPGDSFSSTCLKAMFQGEGLRSRSQQSKETQRSTTKTQLFGPWLSRSIHTYTVCYVCTRPHNQRLVFPRPKRERTFRFDARANTSAFSHRPLEQLCSHAHLATFALPSHMCKTMVLGRENNNKKRANGQNWSQALTVN